MRGCSFEKRLLAPCEVAAVMVLLACFGVRAEEPSIAGSVAEELAKAEQATVSLEETYRSVVKKLEGRAITLRDLESTCFWSERLMLAQGNAAGLRGRDLPPGANRAEPMQQALNDMFDAHIARMEQVEQLVRARAESGQAPAAVVPAARALVVLARASQGSFLHALAAEQDRELDVLLPEPVEAIPPAGKPRELIVSIDAAGAYFVAGKQVTLEELQRVLNAEMVNNPGRASVIVRADRRTRFDRVVEIMNACTEARIPNIRFAAEPNNDDPPQD